MKRLRFWLLLLAALSVLAVIVGFLAFIIYAMWIEGLTLGALAFSTLTFAFLCFIGGMIAEELS